MGVSWRPGALEKLARDAAVVKLTEQKALAIRDRARINGKRVSPRGTLPVTAIVVESGRDKKGPYSDVGFDKYNRGWPLMYHELGTVDFPADPMIRPAVKPGD